MAYYLFNFTSKNADKSRSLRVQAAELLEVGLWGIGDKTANRDALAPGDEVLAYVGAPERAFVGHARLSSPTHSWTPGEAAGYPGTFGSGVSFERAEAWEKPVPLASVWPDMPSSQTNPNAQFFGGVVRIKKGDYDRVLGERTTSGAYAKPVSVSVAPSYEAPKSVEAAASVSVKSEDTTVDRMFAAAERLRSFLSEPHPLSEDATRAFFITKYLEALGYTGFKDLDFGAKVDSGDFADYVLQPGGKRAAVVEAKSLGSPLGAKEAAQVVKYASVLGLRWGVVTDGRYLRLYDARVPNVSPENRLVFDIDIAGYTDKEEFEIALYPDLVLLSKENLAAGTPLEERAAGQGIRELLASADSSTVGALRVELETKKLVHLTNAQLADLLSDLLG